MLNLPAYLPIEHAQAMQKEMEKPDLVFHTNANNALIVARAQKEIMKGKECPPTVHDYYQAQVFDKVRTFCRLCGDEKTLKSVQDEN